MGYFLKNIGKEAPRQFGRRGDFKATYATSITKSDQRNIFESPLEVSVAKLLDLSAHVTHVRSQPFALDMNSSKLLHTLDELTRHRDECLLAGKELTFYVPDLYFETHSNQGSGLIVLEVKDEKWIPRIGTDAHNKLLSAASLLHGLGFSFFLVAADGRQLYTRPWHSNINKIHFAFLSRTSKQDVLSEDFGAYLRIKNELVDALSREQGRNLFELANEFSVVPQTLIHLFVDGLAEFNIQEKFLGVDTIITPTKDCPFLKLLAKLKVELV